MVVPNLRLPVNTGTPTVAYTEMGRMEGAVGYMVLDSGEEVRTSVQQLTLLTGPKAFAGHVDVIQTNAIRSWLLLEPRPHVILFGDEPGTAQVATRLGLTHMPQVATAPSGTPLLNDLFRRAEEVAPGGLLAFVNADIILPSGFSRAVHNVFAGGRPALMVGRRWELDVREPLAFAEPSWEHELLRQVSTTGVQRGPEAIDYFVFRAGLLGEVPPFALGRPAWDNWMIYRARQLGARVVDASEDVVAVHQNHDYTHVEGGFDQVWKGPEAARNRELAGYCAATFSTIDATYVLRNGRQRRALGRAHLRRKMEAAAMLGSWLSPLLRAALLLADATFPMRARLGLALNPGKLKREK